MITTLLLAACGVAAFPGMSYLDDWDKDGVTTHYANLFGPDEQLLPHYKTGFVVGVDAGNDGFFLIDNIDQIADNLDRFNSPNGPYGVFAIPDELFKKIESAVKIVDLRRSEQSAAAG